MMNCYQVNPSAPANVFTYLERPLMIGSILVMLFSLPENAFPQTNAARILRLVFSEQKVSDTAKMYSTHTNLNSRKAILRFLTNGPTRLTERDIIIMHVENHGERRDPVTHFRWSVASACKTSGAQLYDFDCSNVVTNRASAIREMCVLHWKSPYEEPRNLSKTEFYVDEKFMGIAENGLKEAIKQIGEKKARYLGMAGSRYTWNVSYGTFETPFGTLENAVYDCLKTNSITEVYLCDSSAFVAEGKDFYDEGK